MEDMTGSAPGSRPSDIDRGRWRKGIVAVGAALGLTLAGLGIAAAQTDETPEPPPISGEESPESREARPFHKGGFRGGPGRHHMGGGPGIHGEFVTRAPDGGFRTIATQLGEVTSVSASSVTVKSEDDFSRTYAVTDDTLVNAGNDGIDDVEQGDKVHVMAVVEAGDATAMQVRDATQIGRIHDRWNPPADENTST